jgi:hypothetical protein
MFISCGRIGNDISTAEHIMAVAAKYFLTTGNFLSTKKDITRCDGSAHNTL